MSVTRINQQTECPSSVHDLVSCWGGCTQSKTSTDSGLEKRFELNFAQPVDIGTVTVKQLASVMERAGESLRQNSAELGIHTLKFDRSLLVFTAKQIVVRSSVSVMLHEAVHPMLELMRSHNIIVDWASFMRVNYGSPWDMTSETSDIMAHEYAELKSAFPTGHPYLAGPVDRDHCFYFVYDGIDRDPSSCRRENDVQINVYMYNVQADDEYDLDGNTKEQQLLVSHCAGEYETLRVSTYGSTHPFASFETNAVSAASDITKIVNGLLKKFYPERVLLVLLQDRDAQGTTACGVMDRLEGFTVVHRGANHFGGGYVFHQATYARSA